jgi:hypothetical protein
LPERGVNAPFARHHFEGSTGEAGGALKLFAFFHLNLAFSSIEEADRGEVIARCYRPLLKLAETCGAIGIEATGYTLEEIAARDPSWIDELKRLVAAGTVEFIGSGYSQMIGPLVPARLTEANLTIGGEVYSRLLGVRPKIALVNEQAYSGGLVGLYLDAGYQALLMDWDNPAAYHRWPMEARFRPQRAAGADGRSIGLLWTDTVAFQKLQRFAHGDIELDEYLDYIRGRRGETARTFCLYASDAEIFDYRPGRYRSEEVFDSRSGSEWSKLEQAFASLAREPGCALELPSRLMDAAKKTKPFKLESPECPVPVKKQRKYNLSRWAVTGRDDTGLNAACERIYRGMIAANACPEDWKTLCRLWASDNRTHITDKRWANLRDQVQAMQQRFAATLPPPPAPRGEPLDARFVDIKTPALDARLDRRRGMALCSVSFGAEPLIGMLPLGTFEDIALKADWYTGNSVFEAAGEHKVTDLEWCDAVRWQENGDECVFARISTPKGPIEKTMRFHASEPRIDFDLTFHWDEWGKGGLRLGHFTLLDAFDWSKLSLTTHNGGPVAETFTLSGHEVEHGAPVSFLVSASHGFGMTEGWAELGDGRNILRIEVDRMAAPLLGLLTHRKVRGGVFCQLALSALELDDTSRSDPLFPGPRRFRFGIVRRRLAATC